MIRFSKFKELGQSSNPLKRVLKIFGVGGSVYTAKECMPFGTDANPLKNMTAIYSNSTNASERVVIGYINRFQLAAEGEHRIFSVDSVKDSVAAYVWCKANSTLELNGSGYSAVRYENLNSSLQNMINQINTQLTAIQAGITAAGGTYTPTPISVDFTTSRSISVKLK